MSRLTTEEIQTFKRQGYLIKRGILDPELMARARERKWAGAPPRMKKDDPTTWPGPWRPEGGTSRRRVTTSAKVLPGSISNPLPRSGWLA